MIKYQYRVISVTGSQSLKELNSMLLDGWEVFNTVAQYATSPNTHLDVPVYFTIRKPSEYPL
jgi:hypothetical protein